MTAAAGAPYARLTVAAPTEPRAGTPPGPAHPRRAPAADPGQLMRTCPVCGKELAERKCKLYCPDPMCGYFLSCADFY